MRIVHLIKHGHRGNGHVHVAVDLACTQARSGHEVVFASAGGPYEDLLVSCGVRLAPIPDEGGPGGLARSTAAVLQLVAAAKPDVVHAHMMTSAVLARVATTFRGIPVVTTMHNSFDAHSDLMALGQVVVAVSDAERDLLLARGYRPADVVTILNGPVASPREELDASLAPSIDLPTPCIMTLSGLHARKGVPAVVSAFARLSADFGAWHLAIVGDGPDRDAIEAQIETLGLTGRAHLLGSTIAPFDLLRRADVFVSAALAEPFGLSIAEARAAGCAVVATAVGGVPEVLDHGRGGILVPPADEDALVDALRGLLADPHRLREWQERARWGSGYFTVQRMSDDYLALYARLVTQRSRRRVRDSLAHTSSTARLLGRTARRMTVRRRAEHVPRDLEITVMSDPAVDQQPDQRPDRQRRLRVTYFVPPSPVFAGVERVVHEIASALARVHGDLLDVHVVYATHYDEAELLDAPYTRHDLDVTQLRDLASKLRATLARAVPDVFVCAQVEPSVIAWAATRGLGITHFVPHLHGNPAVEERRGGLATKLFFSTFRHLVSRRVSAVLAVAPSLAEYTATHVTRHAPVYWAMNPARALVDIERVQADDGMFRFVNVARHSHQKGLDVLLHAWAIAKPSLPPARLTLVGSGPDEPELRRLADELGIADDVTFAGFQPEPGKQMAQADCFVLSSRWEGFPLVLLEALSVGLPVLAADCDFGPRDLITAPVLGRLVAVEDPTALAAGLVATARQGVDREGDEARRATAAGYRPEAAAEQHMGVLRRIVGPAVLPG